MTIFNNKLAYIYLTSIKPSSLPCPIWSSTGADATRLAKLTSVINNTGLNPKIKTYVTEVPSSISTDRIYVNAGALNVPSLPTRRLIDLNFLAEFTITYAMDFFRDVLVKGIGVNSLTTSTATLLGTPFYDSCRDELIKHGITNLADINYILDPDLDVTSRISKINSVLSNIPKTKATYNDLMDLIWEFVNKEANCLFQVIMPGIIVPDSMAIALGGGGGTRGLYNSTGPAQGLIFFRYSLDPNKSKSTVLSSVVVGNVNRVDRGLNTVMHVSTVGQDFYTGTLGGNPDLLHIDVLNNTDKLHVYIANASTHVNESETAYNKTKYSVASTKENIVVKDKSSGSFSLNIVAAKDAAHSGGDPYDEAFLLLSFTQERQEFFPFDLDSQNQFEEDEFVIRKSVKYSNPNDPSPNTWAIWNTTVFNSRLDRLIDEIVTGNKSIAVNLDGKYVGKRARPYDNSITFVKGDLCYYDHDVYECLHSTSTTPSTLSTQWKIKYPVYSPSSVYNKTDLNNFVVMDDPNDSNKYFLFQANEVGITGIFDETKWRKLSVVEPELNTTSFDTTSVPSTGSLLEAYYDSLRYSFADVVITDSQIIFNVVSYVNPVISRLDLNLSSKPNLATPIQTNKTLTEINNLNTNFTTSQGNPSADARELLTPGAPPLTGLNTDTSTSHKIPVYNITLSCLRSFGTWELLTQRIIERAAERVALSIPTLTTTQQTTVTNAINAAFNASSILIPIARSWKKGLFNTYTKYGKFIKSDWDTYRWDDF